MSHASDEDIRQMNEIVERARAVDEHGHGLCPMCGARAHMFAALLGDDEWEAGARCVICLVGLDPSREYDTREEAEAFAWREWDRAWWRGGR